MFFTAEGDRQGTQSLLDDILVNSDATVNYIIPHLCSSNLND